MRVAFLLIAVLCSSLADPPDVDVMTFNIRYGTARDGENRWEKRRNLVFDVLRRRRPDVVGLQEALRFQIDEIRKHVPGYGEVGEGRDGGKKGEHSAILYREERLHVRESGTFWLSETPGKPSRSWGAACNRICTWGRFVDKASGRSFHVYNTHLDHRSPESREKGARVLVGRIRRRTPRGPFIVTGDFNAAEDSPPLQVLKEEGMVDTFRVLHREEKEVGTYHAFTGRREGKKIDGVLMDARLKVLEAKIVRTAREGRYPSDHFPVTARIRLGD